MAVTCNDAIFSGETVDEVGFYYPAVKIRNDTPYDTKYDPIPCILTQDTTSCERSRVYYDTGVGTPKSNSTFSIY